MNLDDYKVVLYRNQPDGWVAEVPAIGGYHALMPKQEEALAELGRVFEMVAAEYGEKGAVSTKSLLSLESVLTHSGNDGRLKRRRGAGRARGRLRSPCRSWAGGESPAWRFQAESR